MRTDAEPLRPPTDHLLAAPSKVKVKICGIVSERDVDVALRFFVDAIGLNFAPESPRRLTIGRAAELSARARDRAGDRLAGEMDRIGIFVNASADKVLATAIDADLTGVQLHGEETPEEVADVIARGKGLKVIKAFRVRGPETLDELAAYPGCWAYLLDAYAPAGRGGTGETFQWDLAARAARDRRIVLAGGLTPNNVGDAIAQARPYMVDVASGVEEEPGRKDHNFVLSFLHAARRAAAAMGTP